MIFYQYHSIANLIALTSLMSPLFGDRKLKKGDKVIAVAGDFPTTVNPIIQNGLVPVFVDVEGKGAAPLCQNRER